jgi:hypothetical protein
MRSVDDFFLLAEEYEDGDATITNDQGCFPDKLLAGWHAAHPPLKRVKIEPRA